MFKCEYCNKSFAKESTLAVHMCEKKRRHMNRNEKHVQLGYRAYQLFYRIGTNSKKDKTYEEFASSQYYIAFVKFGSYCVDLHVDDVPGLTTWLLKNQIKIDRWTSDQVFNDWLKSRLKTESVDRAFERTVLFMQNWANENNCAWNEYFEKVSSNMAVFHICSGKISPWVLFASNAAQEFLDKLNPEQLQMVVDYIDVPYWQRTFKKYPEDFSWVQKVLSEASLA